MRPRWDNGGQQNAPIKFENAKEWENDKSHIVIIKDSNNIKETTKDVKEITNGKGLQGMPKRH
jgi:ribosomal protein L3